MNNTFARPTVPAYNLAQSNVWSNPQANQLVIPAPISVSFAIPSGYAATVKGGPTLLDPYTVQFQMSPPLPIEKNSCAALNTASFAYTQPNIASAGVLQLIPNGNNRLTIQDGAAGTIQDIVIATGLYDYIDVQTALNIYVRTHAADGTTTPPFMVTGATDLFQLTGIAATQKLAISLNPLALAGGVFPAGGFLVSFANPSPSGSSSHTVDSIGEVLGYPTSGAGDSFTAPAGGTIFTSYAPNVADFGATSAYVLYMSIVTNSYQNGSTGQLLYAFPLGGYVANSVVAYQSTQRLPVQLSAGVYSTVNIWTADQSGNRLPWSQYQAPFEFNLVISKNKKDGSV